ncbi:DUF7572 family protein [Mycolicibacterium mageritense]|uniref:DUF7572 family protein n=1 Tax=Mycolicibacterium mageritense TaxID=53462 RepID=UPI001E54D2CC|nr:hypothetical protein [Mycolicibacterium mageritense]MCC9182557.1 hypothetical protein [Mycolicibacterium mageritense]
MATAELIGERLHQFAPTTNHYRCSDGRYLLVTVHDVDGMATIPGAGIELPINPSHLPTTTDVFLADEYATVLDAEGNPATSMTTLAKIDAVATHAEALEELGYVVT